MNTRRLERLAALRNRLRDQQSVETSEALARHVAGQERLQEAQAAEQDFAARELNALRAMTSTAEVWNLDVQRGKHSAAVERRDEEVRALHEVTVNACAKLRTRTKELKVVERVLDKERGLRAKAEQDQERREVDDIVATRAKGDA